HAIASQGVAHHDGVLPRDVAGLLTLKGVGRYTAGAVACFAYEQRVAMVDTNVRRVLSRVFAIDPQAVDSIADTVVPPQAAYAWNQALMDLGATVCRARRPMCLVCPVVSECDGPRAFSPSPKAAAAFHGSRRYYRGRVIDFLAHLPHGESVSVDDLARQTASAHEQQRMIQLIGQLASDGLLHVDHEQGVRLPD
ncbi:MAG: A/G-specific adenine glycosylase, partial [Chloroflexota bacterium]|nr:A/G-specific adenine glycosylase [Chloroflexota bacterium]